MDLAAEVLAAVDQRGGHHAVLQDALVAVEILEEEVQNTIKSYGTRKRVGEERGLFQDLKSFSEVV